MACSGFSKHNLSQDSCQGMVGTLSYPALLKLPQPSLGHWHHPPTEHPLQFQAPPDTSPFSSRPAAPLRGSTLSPGPAQAPASRQHPLSTPHPTAGCCSQTSWARGRDCAGSSAGTEALWPRLPLEHEGTPSLPSSTHPPTALHCTSHSCPCLAALPFSRSRSGSAAALRVLGQLWQSPKPCRAASQRANRSHPSALRAALTPDSRPPSPFRGKMSRTQTREGSGLWLWVCFTEEIRC